MASWLQTLEHLPQAARFPPVYAKCLHHFVGVLHRLQPYLLSWTKDARLPRTNNDLERFIRAIKTRYRRISGRKNWNAYLLRYGRRTAFYEDFVQHHDAGSTRSSNASAPSPQTVGTMPAISSAHLSTGCRRSSTSCTGGLSTLRLLEQRWSQMADGT